MDRSIGASVFSARSDAIGFFWCAASGRACVSKVEQQVQAEHFDPKCELHNWAVSVLMSFRSMDGRTMMIIFIMIMIMIMIMFITILIFYILFNGLTPSSADPKEKEGKENCQESKG